jgi:hypothetical protein
MLMTKAWHESARHRTMAGNGESWRNVEMAVTAGFGLVSVGVWPAGVWLAEPLTRRAPAGVGLTLSTVSCMLWVR